MSRGNFYGDGNNVDFSQRHSQSESPGGGEAADNSGGNDADRWVGVLQKAFPNHWAWKDDQQSKRVLDEIRMALSGKGTTAEDDALLRQETPEDEYTHQAEMTIRDLERSDAFKYSGQFADPEKRREQVEGLAERLRNPNGNGRKRAQPQEQEKPFSSDEFWSNPEELQKAAKQVRPRKL